MACRHSGSGSARLWLGTVRESAVAPLRFSSRCCFFAEAVTLLVASPPTPPVSLTSNPAQASPVPSLRSACGDCSGLLCVRGGGLSHVRFSFRFLPPEDLLYVSFHRLVRFRCRRIAVGRSTCVSRRLRLLASVALRVRLFMVPVLLCFAARARRFPVIATVSPWVLYLYVLVLPVAPVGSL